MAPFLATIVGGTPAYVPSVFRRPGAVTAGLAIAFLWLVSTGMASGTPAASTWSLLPQPADVRLAPSGVVKIADGALIAAPGSVRIDGLGLVGIKRRGVPIAERLVKMIQQVEKKKVPVGTLDITFYRDDLSTLGPKPVVQEGEIGFSIEGKKIVLVDDVLYTGRTTRAALDALFSHGRPSLVQLLVLIDRGHRELPVEATFIGRTVQTTDNEVIEVKLTETDNAEKVLLMER